MLMWCLEVWTGSIASSKKVLLSPLVLGDVLKDATCLHSCSAGLNESCPVLLLHPPAYSGAPHIKTLSCHKGHLLTFGLCLGLQPASDPWASIELYGHALELTT